MIAPNPTTIIEALRIVGSGGYLGLPLAEFAAKWPGKLPRGVKRRSLAPMGQFLGQLVTRGYLRRSGSRRMPRFTLTRAGDAMLADVLPSTRALVSATTRLT